MKLNWGQGLSIAIVAGVLAILFMVFFTTNQKVDMVTENYYPKELKYQEEIEKMKNTASLANKPVLLRGKEIQLLFPEELIGKDTIYGELQFYRPSDKNKDQYRDFVLVDSGKVNFRNLNLFEGKYEWVLTWRQGDKAYLQKETIYID